MLRKREIFFFTFFMFMCVAQSDFTERSLYAFKSKRREG